MRRTTLQISDNNSLILGKTILENLPGHIKSLKDYTEIWGVLPSTKLLAALVRAGIITEVSRKGEAHVIVNGDDYMTARTFNLNFSYPVPSKIFVYGRDQHFNAAESNEYIISFNAWVRGTEKRVKKGRILFYQPESTPEGYWTVGLPIEFRRQINLLSEKVVQEFLASLLKIR